MSIHFIKLTEPTLSLVDTLNRWENDPTLIPLTRPNKNEEELAYRGKMTMKDLTERLVHHHIYLIYYDDQLIGEMNYMIDPGHLFKKVPGTAWIGITIGDPKGRGKGVGYQAIKYLEEQIRLQDLERIELGVFEFNTQAQKLYQKMGYQEISRIQDFTYWNDRMWADIRMEKILG
ncbi:GNAT family N-acetyltransferase [Alkalihalobacillus sp. TS-13]|uniref:GNAT family N-acetyltransferase n=1 Tax=Alkalihalobacillus sp. TS-13 TaxID=2842455 RepID=UPI001C872845|nr:GNAT family N-acetyltransferase [Alkalihalobacillus sp. TS-13]